MDAESTDDREQPAADAGAAPASAREGVLAVLRQLEAALESSFDEWGSATSRRRTRLQRAMMQGLETRWRIEEQLLLPALHEAEPAWRGGLRAVVREIDLLRELAMLVGQTVSANRQVALSVLQGIAALHFARVHEFIERDGARTVAWASIEDEARKRLARWRAESGLDDGGDREYDA